MSMRANLVLTCCLLLAAALTGQTPDKKKPATEAQKLDRLLAELAKIDIGQWQQKLAQLRGRATQHRRRANSLRKQVRDLEAAAKREEAQAAAVEAELSRLQQVMRLLASQATKPARRVTKKPPASKSAGKKPAEAAQPGKGKTKKDPPQKPAKKRKPPLQKADAADQTAAKAELVAKASAPRTITYDDHVLPVFESRCTGCHDSDDQKGGLDLTTYAAAIRGGGSGRTIVPGNPDRSRLYMLVSHQEKPTMPPDEGPIDKAEIHLIRDWIAAGAPQNKAGAAAAMRQRAARTRRPRPRPAAVAAPKGPPPMPKAWPSMRPNLVSRPVALRTLATSPRAPLLAVPGRRQVLVWHTDNMKLIGVLPFALGEISVLRFSADGSRLLVAGGVPGKLGRAEVFDVASGKRVAQVGRLADTPIAAAISPDNLLVAIGGSNKRLRVYDLATGDRRYEVRDHNEWVLSADFSNDGKHLVSSDRNGNVVVTETHRGRNVHVMRGHRGAVHEVRCSPGGEFVATAGEDRTVRLWRLRDGKERWRRGAARQGVLALAWDSKDLLAVGAADGTLRTFNTRGAYRVQFPGNGEWVYSLGFTSDRKRLLTGDWQGRARVLDLRTRKRLASFVPSMAPQHKPAPKAAPKTAPKKEL